MKLIQTKLTEQIVNILIIFENKREKIEHDKKMWRTNELCQYRIYIDFKQQQQQQYTDTFTTNEIINVLGMTINYGDSSYFLLFF